MTPELYKQLIEDTERICDEQGIELQSKEDLELYAFILFGLAPIEPEPKPFNNEEIDVKQQFKNLGL